MNCQMRACVLQQICFHCQHTEKALCNSVCTSVLMIVAALTELVSVLFTEAQDNTGGVVVRLQSDLITEHSQFNPVTHLN